MIKRETNNKKFQKMINPRLMKGVEFSGKIITKSSEEAKKIYRKNFNTIIVDFKTYRRATTTRKGVYGYGTKIKINVI